MLLALPANNYHLKTSLLDTFHLRTQTLYNDTVNIERNLVCSPLCVCVMGDIILHSVQRALKHPAAIAWVRNASHLLNSYLKMLLVPQRTLSSLMWLWIKLNEWLYYIITDAAKCCSLVPSKTSFNSVGNNLGVRQLINGFIWHQGQSERSSEQSSLILILYTHVLGSLS